jgi:hypothetical protein
MNLKNKIIEYITNKNTNFNHDGLINIFIYFLLSFLITAIVKKFAINIPLVILWSILLLSILYYKDIIRFNNSAIKEYILLTDYISISTIISATIKWCQEHTIETIAILFGIYIANII